MNNLPGLFKSNEQFARFVKICLMNNLLGSLIFSLMINLPGSLKSV